MKKDIPQPQASAKASPAAPSEPAPTSLAPSKNNTDPQANTAVVLPRMEASRLNNPAPTYPKRSRQRGEQGTVVLHILIKADGSVGQAKLQQSSGFSRLDKAALKAIKRWRYQAARQGGKAIDYWYIQAMTFTLN